MTFRELELFLVVADERSFVKAARKLFISQPAVTQQIKKMENCTEKQHFRSVAEHRISRSDESHPSP